MMCWHSKRTNRVSSTRAKTKAVTSEMEETLYYTTTHLRQKQFYYSSAKGSVERIKQLTLQRWKR